MIIKNLFSFLFYNIGIILLLTFIVLAYCAVLAIGGTNSNTTNIIFLFLVVSKNALTYYALYKTKFISDVIKNKLLFIPLIIFDCVVSFIMVKTFTFEPDILFYLILFVLMSVTFSTLSLMLFRKIKEYKNKKYYYPIVSSLTKIFFIFLYFSTLLFVIDVFIIGPTYTNPNIFLRMFILALFTIPAVIFENLACALVFLYFGLFKHFTVDIKKKIIFVCLVEFILYFAIGLYIVQTSDFVPSLYFEG